MTLYTLTKLADPSQPSHDGVCIAWSGVGSLVAVGGGGTWNGSAFVKPFLTLYSASGAAFTKLTNPADDPAAYIHDVDFSAAGDMLACGLGKSPWMAVYGISGSTLTKYPDPVTPPPFQAFGVAFSPTGSHLAVAHESSPFLSIYRITGTTLTKLPNPAALPAGFPFGGVAWSPNGQLLAVAHHVSPFVTIYEVAGETFTKLPDPATLPTNNGGYVAFAPGSDYLTVRPNVFAEGLGSRMLTYEISGTTFTAVPDPVPTPTSGSSIGAAWAPSLNLLAASGALADTRLYEVTKSGGVATITQAGSWSPAMVTSNDLAWAPTSDVLALARGDTPYLATAAPRFG